MLNEPAIREALRAVQEPELGRDIVTLDMVKEVAVGADDAVSLTIQLTTPACPLKDEIERNIQSTLMGLGASRVDVTWSAHVRRSAPSQPQSLVPGVKNIVAVASGKGGVGKSTVSANLAVSLAMDGASVGLLDADITGPNVPLMMGVEGAPTASPDGKIMPLERYGVKVISIQFFVPEGQPIVWRGPLVGGAIQQFLRDVAWGDLDYLVIDLPPGTSDAQLTLAQSVPISGALLVTTPQDVALLDVEKALAMFQRMSVPVMGDRGEHDRVHLPALRRGHRDLRSRGRGGVRTPPRPGVFRRDPARHQGPAGRRCRRAGGRPAGAGSGGEGDARDRPAGRGAHERPRRAAGPGPDDQLSPAPARGRTPGCAAPPGVPRGPHGRAKDRNESPDAPLRPGRAVSTGHTTKITRAAPRRPVALRS